MARREGSITQRAKGAYQLRYYGPPDATNGKSKQINETVKGTLKDAQAALRDRLSAIDKGAFVHKHKETVAEFMNRWLDSYAATNTTLRTQQGYRGYVNRYIGPTIGYIGLQRLSPQQIQGVYAGMLSRGLSATTVVQLHRILKQALGHALKWELVGRNAAESTTPPKIQRKQMKMWDVPTTESFLVSVRGTRFGDFYQLAILTGLRRSELCGLKWEQVDLTRSTLSVVRTLQRIKGHGLVEGTPKTERSRRSIAISPVAVDILHAVRGRQIENQLEVGPLWQSTGFVLTAMDGRPVIPDQVTQDFARVIRRLGLPHLTLHGLRHAHATLMLDAGVNTKIVSERLGHSSIAITADTYSHVLPNMQEQAVLALDQRLSGGFRSSPESE